MPATEAGRGEGKGEGRRQEENLGQWWRKMCTGEGKYVWMTETQSWKFVAVYLTVIQIKSLFIKEKRKYKKQKGRWKIFKNRFLFDSTIPLLEI